jgi:phage gp36-like protein
MPSHDLTIRDTNMAIDLGRLQFQLPDELKSQINQALAVRYNLPLETMLISIFVYSDWPNHSPL